MGNIPQEFQKEFCLSLKKQISIGFQKEFKDIYDSIILLLNECKKINEDKYIEILSTILCHYQKEIFLAQQNIGLKIDALPNQISPRIMVLKDLQNLYAQISESLAKYMFQYYALLCSQVKDDVRFDILNWKIRDCVDYINSTSLGSYRNLTKYYDPVIRNACSHESVKYNNVDNIITFTDKKEIRAITGEEFVDIIYNFKESLNQGCLAFNFYVCSNYNSQENILIKMCTINKSKALDFLINSYITDLFLQDKKDYNIFDSIHIDKILFDNNNLKIRIIAPKIISSKLKDNTIFLTTKFFKPLLIAIKLLKMDIQKTTFEIESGDYTTKLIMPSGNLECFSNGIDPPKQNLFFIERDKKKK